MKLSILDQKNKPSGELELDDTVFGVEPRSDILARVVTWQLARRQAGTHQVKERGDVRGSTRKIYRQKGTGSARHGARKGAQFRGGGIIFGPVTRDHSHDLPKKIRQLGLRMAIAAKIQEGNLLVVNDLFLENPRTKLAQARFSHLKESTALLIDDVNVDLNMRQAVANLREFDILPQIGANVYDILKKDKLIVTANALKSLEARLK
jgi:large subunit ribosomal protein L4